MTYIEISLKTLFLLTYLYMENGAGSWLCLEMGIPLYFLFVQKSKWPSLQWKCNHKKHHVPEWLRTTTHKTALLLPKIRFGHVSPCHSASLKVRQSRVGKKRGQDREKKLLRNVGKKVVACWIMFFFIQVFLIEIKNKNNSRDTWSNSSRRNKVSHKTTNTTLTKTVDTHTVQQWHITCVFVCMCVESVCISVCLGCDRNACGPMEGDALWCVSPPSHLSPPLHSSFYDLLTFQNIL